MIGAGIDSFYEYLLKGYILFGDPVLLEMYQESRTAIKKYLMDEFAHYKIAHFQTGKLYSFRHDALGSFYPGLLVLAGDINGAREAFDLFYLTAMKFGDGLLPEAVNWHLRADMNTEYNLRPELVESAYYLYQATRDPRYIKYGEIVLESIESRCRTACGYAALGRATDGSTKLGRTESFLLSETLKYLYLLFKEDHWLNRTDESIVLTTEAHPLKAGMVKSIGSLYKCSIENPNRNDERLRLLQSWSVGINGLSIDEYQRDLWHRRGLNQAQTNPADVTIDQEEGIPIPPTAAIYIPNRDIFVNNASLSLAIWPSIMQPSYFVSAIDDITVSPSEEVVVLSRRKRRAFEPRRNFHRLNEQTEWTPFEFYSSMSPAWGLIDSSCKYHGFPFLSLHERLEPVQNLFNKTFEISSFKRFAKTASISTVIAMFQEKHEEMRWFNYPVRNLVIMNIVDYAFDYIIRGCIRSP